MNDKITLDAFKDPMQIEKEQNTAKYLLFLINAFDWTLKSTYYLWAPAFFFGKNKTIIKKVIAAKPNSPNTKY